MGTKKNKIGYSKADVAQWYYNIVRPDKKYSNASALNQFRQDPNIDWERVIRIIHALNQQSLTAALRMK